MTEPCRQQSRWFHKKKDLEAHLRKVHDIHVMLPRGLKIDEEEHPTRNDDGPSFFSNYERERSIKRFFDADLKYNRSRQSFLRKLNMRALNKWNAMPKDLRTCTESEFVAKFTREEMEAYDATKDQRMEKLRIKIANGYESYVSMNLKIVIC